MGALAFPLMFAACTNDDFEMSSVNQQTVEGDMIELPENFTFTGTKAESDANTRAGYDQHGNTWYVGWYPVKADGTEIDLTYLQDPANWDKIGLAWLNVTNDGKVYTNYELTHYGWLNSGATGVDNDNPCYDYAVENGVWFDGTGFKRWEASSETTGSEVVETGFNSGTNFAFETSNFTAAKVDANRGMFRTSLNTIFGGNYLVYYPFNPGLKDIDYLTAVMGKEFTNTASTGVKVDQDYQSWIGPHAFMFGRTSIDGGTQASDFSLGQLSGMVAVQVNGKKDDKTGAYTQLKNISTVVLYAPEGGFYTSVKLDATKIQNGAADAALGQALYVAESGVTTKTLISHAFKAKGVTTNDGTGSYGEAFGFPVLPVTLEGVRVLVYDNEGNTSEGVITAGLTNGADGALEVKPNTWTNLVVEATQPNANNMYAYDEASFKQALTKAKNVTSKVTIHLLGTVELTGIETIPANVTVQAESDEDKLVMTTGSSSLKTVLLVQQGATLDCDLDIEGEGCCQGWPAELRMNGNLAADRTIKNQGGKIQFGFKSQDNDTKLTSVIDGTIENNVDPADETNIGSIVINKRTTVQVNGTLTNNGTIEVATAGTGNLNDDAALNIGGTLTNENEITVQGNLSTLSTGTFANNDIFTVKVSAQITGKGVTTQAENAQYICEVNSVTRYNDAINNDKMTAAHRTTLVRFIHSDKVTNPYTTPYPYVLKPNDSEGKIVNVDGRTIDFEVDLNTDEVFQLQHALNDNQEPIATTIGDLTIVNGGFEMEHAALTVANFEINHAEPVQRWTRIEEKLHVTGDVNITNFHRTGGEANLEFEKGVAIGGDMTVANTNGDNIIFAATTENNISGNLKIDKAATVSFGANTVNSIGATLTVDNSTVTFGDASQNTIGVDIDVNATGKMTFDVNSITAIINWFHNDGQVEFLPATGLDDTDVAARVTCTGYDHEQDPSYWTNGSYPVIR